MSERLTKKRLKEDKFIDVVQETLAKARENTALSIVGVVGFVVLVAFAVRVGGQAAGGSDVSGKELDAQRALVQARGSFLQGQLEQGRDALDAMRSQHSGTSAAKEATYLLGNTLFELGDYARAQEVFSDFLQKPVFDEVLEDGAKFAIAACKEESGQTAQAISDYRSLADSGTNPATRLQAMMAAARLSRTQGNTTDAVALYERVVDAFPGSPEANEAEFALLLMGQAEG